MRRPPPPYVGGNSQIIPYIFLGLPFSAIQVRQATFTFTTNLALTSDHGEVITIELNDLVMRVDSEKNKEKTKMYIHNIHNEVKS